jgi:predicted dehydrogenase
MKTTSRRSFLRSSLAAGAALSLPAKVWAQAPGSNSAVRAAVIGFHGRGSGHISELLATEGVRITALCDVDSQVLEGAVKRLRDKGTEAKPYTDLRKLLEDKNVDVITTATPNHWHSLIVVWGCQAGKDVYVEKPVSHNVWEGRQAVNAARKYNRIVQAGTQSRSNTSLREALAWVREGNLGKFKVSRGLCYKPRPSIGRTSGPQAVPTGLDYDLWTGPAPLHPPYRNNPKYGPVHYDWHWFWDYGAGDLGNQGIHQMDVARWALGKNTLSPKVFSVGGRLGYEDDAETPNTQFVVHDYGDAQLIFEVRGLPAGTGQRDMDKYRGQSVGNTVECEGGYLSGSKAFDKDGKLIKEFKADREGSHMANFIKAVRSRKVSDLNADILEGHLSSGLCHTGNISHRLGDTMDPDQIAASIKSNGTALECLDRMKQHLAANGVDLKQTRLTLGPVLTMDPKTERFTNSREADALLTRLYRRPFVVPENV